MGQMCRGKCSVYLVLPRIRIPLWYKCAVLLDTAHPYHVVIDYPVALSAVSRVVSVCRFAHPHSLKSSIIQQAKNLIKRQGSFHKPNQVFRLAWLPVPELMG